MLMLHLMLVFTVGDMFHAKLIRCHRTELIREAMLAFMVRPWLGLSVGSLMRITKVGRLCARGYPGPVNGDSLESQFGYWYPVPVCDKFVCHEVAICHAMAGVSGGHGVTHEMTREVCQVIR